MEEEKEAEQEEERVSGGRTEGNCKNSEKLLDGRVTINKIECVCDSKKIDR